VDVLAATSVGPLSERARRAGAAYAGPGSGPGRTPSGPRPIAFTGGLPDPILLPTAALAEATASILGRDANAALQYGGVQGWDALRDWLAGHCSIIDHGTLTADYFCITNGSAGALANVCETFVDTGDIVGVEAPSFPLSIRTIRSITPRIESIPVDDDGVVVDALERTVVGLAGSGQRMRAFYTIPTFHNPTGSTLILERRHRLLDLCRRYGVLIVEDHAYSELWFGDEPPPSLYSLAEGQGVIKIGTFSKIMAPGLRAGWCQALPPVIAALVATRCDMGTSPLLLRALEELGRTGFIDQHIDRLRIAYEHKRDTMLEALQSHCSGMARWNTPTGGFFIWVTMTEDIDPKTLAAAAREEGVTFVGGQAFFAEQATGEGHPMPFAPNNSRHLRLAFSNVAEDEIPEGIGRLGRAMARAAHA